MRHDHAQHRSHDDHGGHEHADHVEVFRRLFWVMLVLAVPVVGLSEMFAMLAGYSLPESSWLPWVSPVLGTVMYLWGGRPFLEGGWSETRSRRPGMMLLIASLLRSGPPGARAWGWSTTPSTSGGSWRCWW